MLNTDLFKEANRQLVICNACRYCEGLCPVFQAIELRRDFLKGDVLYLANLCHDCRACFPACMYTAPHEFKINIPAVMSEARIESYSLWAWPKILSSSFKNTSIRMCLGAGTFIVVMLLGVLLIPHQALTASVSGTNSFYKIIPYWLMVSVGLSLTVYWTFVWVVGAIRCWKDIRHEREKLSFRAILQTIWAIATLAHMNGGGGSCTYPSDNPSDLRRIYHSLVFWGFTFDLISTSLAFFYQEILQRHPPFPVFSAPVLFGSIGGLGLVVGSFGLIALKIKSNKVEGNEHAYAIDYSFLSLLALVSLTGLATLVVRETSALGIVLTIHLGLVASLFVTAPYGKFVHGVYRSLALANFYLEKHNRIQK